MTCLQTCTSIASYFVFQMGVLLLWPRRQNLVAWLSLPLFITAYVLPLTVIDYSAESSLEVIDRLMAINGAGALAMALGLFIGGAWLAGQRRTSAPAAASLAIRRPELPREILIERVVFALALSNVTMTLCFVWLGGLPVFAEDIFLAKFFRGDYKIRYDQISVFYRLSQTVLVTLMPIAVALAWQTRSRSLLVLAGWSMVMFAGALNRGLVLAGVIVVVAAWCTTTRLRWMMFMLGSTLLVVGGSIAYSVLGLIDDRNLSIVQEIAWGAPDVSDQLQFLAAFEVSTPWTYGLTFIGGLVPSSYHFNPSVFTLAVLNGSDDISDVGSGGLRLSPALYGYIAFSWIGAVVVPFLSGLLQAPFIARLRRAFKGDLVDKTIGVQVYFVMGSLAYAFYAISYQSVIAVLIMGWVLARPRLNTRRVGRREMAGKPVLAQVDASAPNGL